MSVEDYTPVTVERELQALANSVAKMIPELDRLDREKARTKRELDRAIARETLVADGATVADRAAQVELATIKERDEKEVAELAAKYAANQLRALETRIDILRSIGVGVRQAYALAGRWEP